MCFKFLPVCLIALAFTVLFFISCNNDKCATIQCAHHGVCHDGSCSCASGYEGPQCETFSRRKFVGSWIESDSTPTGNVQYPVTVAADTVVSNILITHLCNYFTVPVVANISYRTFTIPLQTLQYKKVQGQGYFNDNGTVTVICTVTDASGAVYSHNMLWH